MKEKEISGNRILIIHGDTCELPEKLTLVVPDMTIQDWIRINEDNDKIKNIIDWLKEMKEKDSTTSMADHFTGTTRIMLI